MSDGMIDKTKFKSIIESSKFRKWRLLLGLGEGKEQFRNVE